MQTEAASVYDKEFKESEILFIKLLNSIKSNGKCFENMIVEDIEILKLYSSGYKELQLRFSSNNQYEKLAD